MSESAFFLDLAILMTAAGVVSVVCSRFNLPKVVGYIFAGIAMSPFTWGGSLLADAKSVQTIGQLGVVFLMFAMGLDFSTSDVKRMRFVTVPVALIDTIVMTWLGYTVGTRVLGWEEIPSLFLGAAICDSATTMLAKVVDELKCARESFVKYSLGTSVCEDIVCVGIIALITGVAHGRGMDLGAACYSMGGLFVFFLAVIAFGLVIVPMLLNYISRWGDEEMILTILGCLFGVSYVAYRLDYSLALGAFLVGILGAASGDVRKRLARLAFPLRSMFAAVFFVSIGFLVDPMAWLRNLPAILLVSAVVVVGKFVNCALGALIVGERVKTAVQMGMSLAQIGEFAFMVALLYATCTGDMTSPMYQIVIAVSVLTTLLNPFMIRRSERVGEWVEARLPARVKSFLETYQGFVNKFRQVEKGPELSRDTKGAAVRLVLLAVLLFAVSTACGLLHKYDYSRFSEFFEAHDKLFFFIIVDVFALLLAPMVFKLSRTLGEDVSVVLVRDEEQRWQQALRRIIALIITIAVCVGFFIEAAMINVNLLPEGIHARVSVAVAMLIFATIFWKFFANAGRQAAERFRESLSANERREKLAKVVSDYTLPAATISRFPLDKSSPAVGETVVSLNVRARTGATILSVERAGKTIRNVGPVLRFRSGDVLVATGDNGQIDALRKLLSHNG